MTTTTTHPPIASAVSSPPGRRVLLALSLGYLLFFVVLVGFLGSDNAPDADPASLMAADHASPWVIQVTSYASMVACASLVFFGAGVRSLLVARTPRWTADVAMIGFVVMALTVAGWAVSGLAMWQAVDLGDPAAVRAMNLIDTSNFLPAMLAMICAYVGVGVSAIAGRALPKWLGVVSIGLGCLAPLGPGGFVPFVLFPVWMVVVAALLRPVPAPS